MRFFLCATAALFIGAGLVFALPGAKLPNGQKTITATSRTHDSVIGSSPTLAYVTNNGNTLTIPCECPMGVPAPCFAVFHWDAAKKSYVGDNCNCDGGTTSSRLFIFDNQTNDYSEQMVAPPTTKSAGSYGP